MEPGQYQLQILVSLIVILAVAFVALICDLSSGHNKHLREFAIELQPRGDDRRGAHLRTAQSLELTPAAANVSAAAIFRIAEPGGEAVPASVADALAKTAEGETNAEPAPVVPVRPSVTAVNPEVILETAFSETVFGETAVGEAAPREIAHVKTGVGAKRDWGALLARADASAESGVGKVRQTGHLEQIAPGIPLPTGFHDRYFLNRMIQRRLPVSGVVVSIGGNKADGTDYRGVRRLIQTLIGPRDFACQSSEYEFLLIFPDDSGAAAQRRLNEIAQKLWSFQLGSLGARSILLSWGGVEVHSESIDEAIASATERMHEAMRGNRLRTMEFRPKTGLRQAG